MPAATTWASLGRFGDAGNPFATSGALAPGGGKVIFALVQTGISAATVFNSGGGTIGGTWTSVSARVTDTNNRGFEVFSCTDYNAGGGTLKVSATGSVWITCSLVSADAVGLVLANPVNQTKVLAQVTNTSLVITPNAVPSNGCAAFFAWGSDMGARTVKSGWVDTLTSNTLESTNILTASTASGDSGTSAANSVMHVGLFVELNLTGTASAGMTGRRGRTANRQPRRRRRR